MLVVSMMKNYTSLLPLRLLEEVPLLDERERESLVTSGVFSIQYWVLFIITRQREVSSL